MNQPCPDDLETAARLIAEFRCGAGREQSSEKDNREINHYRATNWINGFDSEQNHANHSATEKP